jgi:hypothetical protein
MPHSLRWQNFSFDDESRGLCGLTSANDAKGGSQFCAILRQVHPSFWRPYGTIYGLAAEVPTTEGYADACMFKSL